jgi:hypothetical protein
MTRIGLAVAGTALTAALAACGGGDDFTDSSAEQMVKASMDAMDDLDALKVSGSIVTDGQQIDLEVQTNADGDCTGNIGVGDGTAELVGVGGSVWFKPDQAFWEASAGDAADQVVAAVGDKWVIVPEDEDGFSEFCDVDQLLDQLLADDQDSTYSKGDTEDVDGQDAVAVDNKTEDDGTSTGYIAVDEPHYLLKLEKTEGEDTGTVTFSEFDEDFEVEAPADDDAVDLSTLGG